MTRLRFSLALIAAIVTAAACADSPTAPVNAGTGMALRDRGATAGAVAGSLPGSFTTFKGKVINCVPKAASFGSALIGPAGGDLIIGTHRLIVPPGALTQPVVISGTVPAGETFRIDLQPHGLQFRKPAGLILDASSCLSVPTIVYLLDDLYPQEPIPAVYSNWWHTIAAPIWHFSGYAVAMRSCSSDAMLNRAARNEMDAASSSCSGSDDIAQ